jgi:long-chain acyl-CoA synthetase
MLLHDFIARNVQTRPDGLATQYLDRNHNWAEFSDRIARLSAGLHALNLTAGGRLALLSFNSDRYTECLFATSYAGGVFVPINTRLALPEIAYWLNDSASEILCIGDEFLAMLPTLRKELHSLRHIVYIGEAGVAPDGLIAADDLIAAHAPAPGFERAADDLVALYYTGGTTGKSKGVMLSHRNLIANAFNFLPLFDIEANSRYLHAAPMFHIADAAGGFTAALVGAANFYVPKFEPQAVLRCMESQAITHTLLVPTMVNILANHPDLPQHDLAALSVLAYGGSPMPEAVIRRTVSILPHIHLLQLYGQTEAAPILSINRHEDHIATGVRAARVRSAGRAAYGVQLRILDIDGREVPCGEVGEICARGDVVMLGYWNKAEQTARTLHGGWLHTGDSGTMDADGFVYVCDRLKDMIISGGENVYSVEVEEALFQHPEVDECAVIGVPHAIWGEAVHAVVRLRDGSVVDEDALIAHCRVHIAGFKCPRGIELRTQPLPVNGAGKILKEELRAPYWAGRAHRVN